MGEKKVFSVCETDDETEINKRTKNGYWFVFEDQSGQSLYRFGLRSSWSFVSLNNEIRMSLARKKTSILPVNRIESRRRATENPVFFY
jgi:hypothetical protein